MPGEGVREGLELLGDPALGRLTHFVVVDHAASSWSIWRARRTAAVAPSRRPAAAARAPGAPPRAGRWRRSGASPRPRRSGARRRPAARSRAARRPASLPSSRPAARVAGRPAGRRARWRSCSPTPASRAWSSSTAAPTVGEQRWLDNHCLVGAGRAVGMGGRLGLGAYTNRHSAASPPRQRVLGDQRPQLRERLRSAESPSETECSHPGRREAELVGAVVAGVPGRGRCLVTSSSRRAQPRRARDSGAARRRPRSAPRDDRAARCRRAWPQVCVEGGGPPDALLLARDRVELRALLRGVRATRRAGRGWPPRGRRGR